MDEMEEQYMHLHTGSIPFRLKKVCIELEYWLNRRSYLNKKHHNVRQLLVLQNKLQLKHNPNLLKADLINKIKLAYEVRQEYTLVAESLSL